YHANIPIRRKPPQNGGETAGIIVRSESLRSESRTPPAKGETADCGRQEPERRRFRDDYDRRVGYDHVLELCRAGEGRERGRGNCRREGRVIRPFGDEEPALTVYRGDRVIGAPGRGRAGADDNGRRLDGADLGGKAAGLLTEAADQKGRLVGEVLAG